jgi:hypothetical protein
MSSINILTSKIFENDSQNIYMVYILDLKNLNNIIF